MRGVIARFLKRDCDRYLNRCWSPEVRAKQRLDMRRVFKAYLLALPLGLAVGLAWTLVDFAPSAGFSAGTFIWSTVAIGFPVTVFVAMLCTYPLVRRVDRFKIRADRFGPNACRRCAYDLSGLAPGPCPECGAERRRE